MCQLPLRFGLAEPKLYEWSQTHYDFKGDKAKGFLRLAQSVNYACQDFRKQGK